VTSEIRLFTRVSVATAKSVVANPDEPADPEGGRGFAEWAMLTLHALRIELGKSYRVTVDLLSEMPGVLDEIGLTRLPHYTVHPYSVKDMNRKPAAICTRTDEERMSWTPPQMLLPRY
jgi:hypothetical protein